MSNQPRSLSNWRLRSLSASTAERPIRKNPLVTLTASPASGTPRVDSDCFIRMPGTLEMPPDGKSAGSLGLHSKPNPARFPRNLLSDIRALVGQSACFRVRPPRRPHYGQDRPRNFLD